jgi:hypothetical protein
MALALAVKKTEKNHRKNTQHTQRKNDTGYLALALIFDTCVNTKEQVP